MGTVIKCIGVGILCLILMGAISGVFRLVCWGLPTWAAAVLFMLWWNGGGKYEEENE